MTPVKTGNATHDAVVVKQVAIAQGLITTTSTKAAIVTAESAAYKEIAVSAAANSCSPSQTMFALREMGKGLYDA